MTSRKICKRSAKARATAQALIARGGVLSERRASQCTNLVLNCCNFSAGAAEVHFVYWLGTEKVPTFQLELPKNGRFEKIV